MPWSQSESFVNPYNFVAVSLHREKSTPQSGTSALHTGVLHCKLETKTPLAIPDTEEVQYRKEDPEEHGRYPFFHYKDDVPVIPGSSIRGAVRSMYETVSDSCFSTARADSVITTRVRDPYQPGLLIKEGGQWKLYRAERFLVAKDKGKKEISPVYNKSALAGYGFGRKVFFTYIPGSKGRKYVDQMFPAKEGSTPLKGRQEGYLYIGEDFPKKRYESVFVKKGFLANVAEKEISGLLKTIDVYQDEKVNKKLEEGHSGYEGAKSAFEKGIVPVWYKSDEAAKRTYLSMASIGRVAYQKDMGELLDKRKSCNSENLCKACALFGMISDTYKSASKVRITDARAVGGQVQKEVATLKELASPHSSYLPFYATRPGNGKDWSYDSGAEIRGRKYYWHFDYKKSFEEKTKRNATMELVLPQAIFEFQVYYDGITDEQLQELIWTLTLGENEKESNLCYKLGHGKPLGLGSVKIWVEKREERTFDGDCYHVLEEALGGIIESPFEDSQTLRQVMRISDIKAVDSQRVEYPRVMPARGVKPEGLPKNKLASHQWFSNNYVLGRSSKDAMLLPEITESKLSLPALEVDGGSGDRQKKNYDKRYPKNRR